MFKLTWKNLLAHRRRLAATFIAVVLGVAFLSGNLVLTDTITRTFNDLFADVNRGTDAVVRSSVKIEGDFGNDIRGRYPTTLLPTVQDVDGVKAAEPQVLGYGQIVGNDGKTLGNPGMGAPTFAGNWNTVPELNPFRIVNGRAPTTIQRDRDRQAVGGRRPSHGGSSAPRSSRSKARTRSRSSGSRSSEPRTARAALRLR